MMDAKYLEEIKAREQAAKDVLAKAELSFDAEYRPLLEAISDISALIAEVERMTEMYSVVEEANEKLICRAEKAESEVERLQEMLADSFQGHLLNELDAKDQQIAALKKALERAEEHINEIYSYLDYDYCGSCQQVKEAVEDYRYGIQQAQEQEAEK